MTFVWIKAIISKISGPSRFTSHRERSEYLSILSISHDDLWCPDDDDITWYYMILHHIRSFWLRSQWQRKSRRQVMRFWVSTPCLAMVYSGQQWRLNKKTHGPRGFFKVCFFLFASEEQSQILLGNTVKANTCKSFTDTQRSSKLFIWSGPSIRFWKSILKANVF